MKLKKDDIYSWAGSIGFHLVIFLILWFTVLKTIVPEEEEGILVNFGNLNAAAGTFEPRYTGETLQPQTYTPPPPSTPVVEQQEELLTQDVEESVSLTDPAKEEERRQEEERQRREQEERERQRREEEERRRREEELQRMQQEADNRMAGLFGIGSADNSSQGDATEGQGNQGSPFGNSDQGANEGVGGYGTFNLNGRFLGRGGLPRPSYNVDVQGKIVLDITVDPRGNVIDTRIARGTNITDATLRKSAEEAARRAKFNSIQGVNNQTGTITYIYELR